MTPQGEYKWYLIMEINPCLIHSQLSGRTEKVAYPGWIYMDTASDRHSEENEHFVYVTVARSFPLLSIACQNLPASITAVLHDLGFRPLEVSRIAY